jgi:hypothetical protein
MVAESTTWDGFECPEHLQNANLEEKIIKNAKVNILGWSGNEQSYQIRVKSERFNDNNNSSRNNAMMGMVQKRGTIGRICSANSEHFLTICAVANPAHFCTVGSLDPSLMTPTTRDWPISAEQIFAMGIRLNDWIAGFRFAKSF